MKWREWRLLLWLGVSPRLRLGPRQRRVLKSRCREAAQGLPTMPVLRELLLSLQIYRWTENPPLGLYLQMGNIEAALGYGNFLDA